jgi:hypothetical protein
MYASLPIHMAEAPSSKSMFLLSNIDGNRIQSEGLEYAMRANWKKLQ